MQLSGIHHLTAVSADAPGNVRFYTHLLGLRMVKKTVNQDDVSAYHLFYADGLASPGSDITSLIFPPRASSAATTASPAPACAFPAKRVCAGGTSACKRRR
jgi:glyoxalase family protein